MQMEDHLLETLTSFTLRLFKDIFNKTYENDLTKFSYWLAPIRPEIEQIDCNCRPQDLIDWSSVLTVHKNEELSWDSSVADSFFEKRFLVDRWDGGRRFFSVAVEPGLKPLDPVPPNSATGKYMDNILDYSVSLFKKSRLKAQWNKQQPVVAANKVLFRRNYLDEITPQEHGSTTKCYVCPEPLKISALPASVASMGLVLPAIISRIESCLIALESFAVLGLEVDPRLALEAVTKDSDNTEEHRSEQIHLQRGMGKNYERLEFIGDCFLKMATSISLFAQNPDNDEFEYHVKRMLLICNKNLFNTAKELNIYEYIRSQGFSRRLWYPEGLKLLEGKGHNKTGEQKFQHALGDKTIADVCEAMIGAALVTYREIPSFDMAVRAVTQLVNSPDHTMQKWEDYYKAYNKPSYQTAAATASQRDLAINVEKKNPYRFKFPTLLRSAFVHPSYPMAWERIPCYQRLEFLGDALLDMTSINYLFYRFPDKDPQWLTEHKMAMVSNQFLAAVCVKLQFHRHLRYNSSSLEYQIRDYVTELQEVEREANGGRDFWTQIKNPPKCLPDIVESYVGAMFVDAEFDFRVVEEFFDAHIRWFFEDMSIYDTFANAHPTTFLTNLLTLTFFCTDFRILAQELPPLDPTASSAPPQVLAAVIIHDNIVADANAASGRQAKLAASERALDALKGLSIKEFGEKYACSCARDGMGVGENEKVGFDNERSTDTAV
ncbi:MAG: hypothetical protein M1819_005951 [Sarea resinae]|nr:MAG: hypothetical protein M1819_005951 [Sarea resinae]